eukprot:CAMPEP_0174353172 /NCGR_PEP_ID=MMETSP0811_2-20130205/14005_1 /TAXON_ID=73025 ORGANISM="Eutreptiella gymnastica-like, Strain CCMP1594" /NCGR_SAMPLE_ID=MMETSP0811_2 /ASSEMBLY_ACC=CAM_ASM_000667 /LENGTH=45 /DNA_ID= /DNA_START= /DNA_END= /DNA_ORIENTATION=
MGHVPVAQRWMPTCNASLEALKVARPRGLLSSHAAPDSQSPIDVT